MASHMIRKRKVAEAAIDIIDLTEDDPIESTLTQYRNSAEGETNDRIKLQRIDEKIAQSRSTKKSASLMRNWCSAGTKKPFTSNVFDDSVIDMTTEEPSPNNIGSRLSLQESYSKALADAIAARSTLRQDGNNVTSPGIDIINSPSSDNENSSQSQLRSWTAPIGIERWLHAASEEHMAAIVSGMSQNRTWESTRSKGAPRPYIRPYGADYPISVECKSLQWQLLHSITTKYTGISVDAMYCPSRINDFNLCNTYDEQILTTLRVEQVLNNEVPLPISNRAWCQVKSLSELEQRHELAQSLQRMLMVVCSNQGPTLWEPIFAKWATIYPRIMFASLNTNDVNASCNISNCISAESNRRLRKDLLGFDTNIDALCFITHHPHQEMKEQKSLSSNGRFFNALQVETEEIKSKLLTRYQVDKHQGLIPILESDCIHSELKVNDFYAFMSCTNQLLYEPIQLQFRRKIRKINFNYSSSNANNVQASTRDDQMDVDNCFGQSTNVENDFDLELCFSDGALLGSPLVPFLIRDNSNILPSAQPENFLVPLRIDQLRSLQWMLLQENRNESELIYGTAACSSQIAVPPFHDLVAEWCLMVGFSLRGGILADSVGFGKTAISLALISSGRSILKNDSNVRRIQLADSLHSIKLSSEAKNDAHITFKRKKISSIVTNTGASGGCDLSANYSLYETRATLIIVPSHLVGQWADEVQKFCGLSLKSCVIYAVDDIPLVQDIQDADIVIVSQRLFISKGYQKMLGLVSEEDDENASPMLKNTSVHDNLSPDLASAVKRLRNHRLSSGKKKRSTSKTPNRNHDYEGKDTAAASYDIQTYEKNFDILDKHYMDAVHMIRKYSVHSEDKLSLLRNPFDGRIAENIPDILRKDAAWKRIIADPKAKGKKGRKIGAVWPLEKYAWERIIFDEVHELGYHFDKSRIDVDRLVEEVRNQQHHSTSRQRKDQLWVLPMRSQIARSKWGLTGTPIIQRTADVHGIAAMLGIHLGVACPELCRRFVRDYMRSSVLSNDECSWPEPENRNIFFSLTAEEKALYQNRSYELSQDLANQNPVAMRELLLSCNHFSLRGGTSVSDIVRSASGVAGNAEDEISRMRQKKLDRQNLLTNKIKDLRGTLQSLSREVQIAVEKDLPIPQLEKVKRIVAGKREEVLDEIHSAEQELKRICDTLRFFDLQVENTIESFTANQQNSNDNEILGECPICLDEMRWGEGPCAATISSCGHKQCMQCAQNWIDASEICATCRAPLKKGQWVLMRRQFVHDEHTAASQAANDVHETVNARAKLPIDFPFGSKISEICTKLIDIYEVENNPKVLLYCQWDALKMKLIDALRLLHLPYMTLDGNPKQLAAAVARFASNDTTPTSKRDTTSAPFIMLCSLEHKAAGLNLQIANHVMFAHPFFSSVPEHPASWEAQAVGRVLRPGQKRKVTIWRFVATDTIEQDLYVQSRDCKAY